MRTGEWWTWVMHWTWYLSRLQHNGVLGGDRKVSRHSRVGNPRYLCPGRRLCLSTCLFDCLYHCFCTLWLWLWCLDLECPKVNSSNKGINLVLVCGVAL